MEYFEIAKRMIEEQQAKHKEGTAPWVVGEQLKEIAEREPKSAELLAQDIAVDGMGIADAEKKIKAYADKHKSGGFSYVSPKVAEGILREFYGLPAAGAEEVKKPQGKIDLADFI